MDIKNYIEIPRLWLLLKMEFFRNRKGLIMTLVITFGLLFVGFLLDVYFGYREVYDSHPGGFGLGLLLGGFILSSLSFNDLSDTLRRYNYLTLPASNLEKFISLWLLTSVGWIVLFTISFLGYTLIANSIAKILFSHVTFLPFEPLGEVTIQIIKIYFVVQGIFLAGAVHFRGYVFPKMLFTLILFAAVCGTLAYYILSDLFLMEHECKGTDCEILNGIVTNKMCRVVQLLFWWVLAPLSWVITYLGLKDQEV